jgi:hypothetical protein
MQGQPQEDGWSAWRGELDEHLAGSNRQDDEFGFWEKKSEMSLCCASYGL